MEFEIIMEFQMIELKLQIFRDGFVLNPNPQHTVRQTKHQIIESTIIIDNIFSLIGKHHICRNSFPFTPHPPRKIQSMADRYTAAKEIYIHQSQQFGKPLSKPIRSRIPVKPSNTGLLL